MDVEASAPRPHKKKTINFLTIIYIRLTPNISQYRSTGANKEESLTPALDNSTRKVVSTLFINLPINVTKVTLTNKMLIALEYDELESIMNNVVGLSKIYKNHNVIEQNLEILRSAGDNRLGIHNYAK